MCLLFHMTQHCLSPEVFFIYVQTLFLAFFTLLLLCWLELDQEGRGSLAFACEPQPARGSWDLRMLPAALELSGSPLFPLRLLLLLTVSQIHSTIQC